MPSSEALRVLAAPEELAGLPTSVSADVSTAFGLYHPCAYSPTVNQSIVSGDVTSRKCVHHPAWAAVLDFRA